MYIDANTIITAGSFIVASGAILTCILKIHKWYLKQEAQDLEIAKIKEENTLICSAPTLSNTNAFTDIPADCEIRVPAALYDEWIAATNWSTYASKIVAV